MTEAEWLVCENPGRMLAQVVGRLSPRKLLLFGAAIVRRHPNLLELYAARDALDLVERYADGQASEAELAAKLARFPGLLGALSGLDGVALAFAAEWLRRLDSRLPVRERERRIQADLLREIAGNPFRQPCLDPAWLEANDGLAVWLAQTAVDERRLPEGHLDGTRLAILGDALEEAGCCDEQVLSHLRVPGPHVLGCWATDLLTGRA
jgi:hypothetical protein